MKPLRYASLAFVLFAAPSAYAEDVSGCGATVSNGVLTSDLDCSAGGCAVSVLDGGTLDLAGHTITVSEECGVSCERDCAIEGGGGTVTGSATYGIHSFGKRGRVRISNLELSVSPTGPVQAPPIMTNYCVYSEGPITIEGSTFSACGYGVFGRRSVEVRDSTFTGNGIAVHADRNATIENTTMSGGTAGAGVERRLELTNVTATDNGYWGASAKRLSASTSTITGNGGDPDCNPEAFGCQDIRSNGRPALGVVACDTSGRLDRYLNQTPDSWGVCTLD